MSHLICITGMDGSGKDTLIQLLKNKLKSVVVAGIWDGLEGEISSIPFKSKKDIDIYLFELTPDARTLFLTHALKYSIDCALASKANYILLNAYYFKYFATELTLGASPILIRNLISSFPIPDKTFYLDLAIEEASERKKLFSAYECGFSHEINIKSFIDFQNRVKEKWNEFNKEKWIILNASLTPEDILKDVMMHIEP